MSSVSLTIWPCDLFASLKYWSERLFQLSMIKLRRSFVSVSMASEASLPCSSLRTFFWAS